MNRLLISITVLILILSSCTSTGIDKKAQAELSAKITELESKLMDANTYALDYQVAKELIPAYIKFVNDYPKDSLSPDYLYKAAEISQGLGQGNQSVKYYEKFITEYPENKRANIALFQMAFVYENVVQNKELAVKYYQEFTEKYPNHELVPSAEVSIANIDKSPEELIKEFQEKEKPEVDSQTKYDIL